MKRNNKVSEYDIKRYLSAFKNNIVEGRLYIRVYNENGKKCMTVYVLDKDVCRGDMVGPENSTPPPHKSVVVMGRALRNGVIVYEWFECGPWQDDFIKIVEREELLREKEKEKRRRVEAEEKKRIEMVRDRILSSYNCDDKR